MESKIITRQIIRLSKTEVRIAIRKWIEETHVPIVVLRDGWALKFVDNEVYVEFDIGAEATLQAFKDAKEGAGLDTSDVAPGIRKMLERGDLDDPGQEDED